MLLLHVVDLHIGQIAQLECRLNGVARLIGMYMTLDDLLIVHYNDTVADGFQISAQSQWVCVRVLFIDDELGAVAEMDVLFVKFCCHAVCFLFLRSCLLFLHGGNNLAALDDRQHTLPDLYKALSARIDYPGFFEHRQHLRCLCQSVLRTDQDFFPHLCCGQLLFLRCQLLCISCQSCYGQDGTFRRLHNCFVCGGDTHRQCVCNVLCIRFLFALQAFGEAAEQQRKDNAGVSSCATQQSRGCLFGYLLNGWVIPQGFQLPFCRIDGHRHICSGVAVRYREYIERVYLLSAI